jgi:hypothetical protein
MRKGYRMFRRGNVFWVQNNETRRRYRTESLRQLMSVSTAFVTHSFRSAWKATRPGAVVESIVGHSNPAMTRHYTHVGKLAASNAVAALPAVIGDAKPSR